MSRVVGVVSLLGVATVLGASSVVGMSWVVGLARVLASCARSCAVQTNSNNGSKYFMGVSGLLASLKNAVEYLAIN